MSYLVSQQSPKLMSSDKECRSISCVQHIAEHGSHGYEMVGVTDRYQGCQLDNCPGVSLDAQSDSESE